MCHTYIALPNDAIEKKIWWHGYFFLYFFFSSFKVCTSLSVHFFSSGPICSPKTIQTDYLRVAPFFNEWHYMERSPATFNPHNMAYTPSKHGHGFINQQWLCSGVIIVSDDL